MRTEKPGVFSYQTLLIHVGEDGTPFHIHPATLATTDFFKVEGDPPTAVEKETRQEFRRTTSSMVTPPVELKREPERSPSRSPTIISEQRSPINHVSSTIIPDYHLTGHSFTPAAFEVVVKWLYNQPPTAPTNRGACKTILRAYVLAFRWGIEGLQDAIVENYQKYHRGYELAFDDLVWMINRFGDSAVCRAVPMVWYLADQTAYEITTHGYDQFVKKNHFFHQFLTTGDRPIRAIVVEAIVNIAGDPKPVDPASGPNRWRVEDFKHPPPQSPASEMEVIELDD